MLRSSEAIESRGLRYRLRAAGRELGEVADVAVGPDGRVYAFTRGPHPVLVLDRDGDLVDQWGEGLFVRPHGIRVASDGTVFAVDAGAHAVRVLTSAGAPLLTIDDPGARLGACTQTALTPDGDLLVAGGDGRIHWFAAEGRLICSWGEAGGPADSIACDEEGWVYIAEGGADRIRIVDVGGDLREEWGGLRRPVALHLDGGLLYVAEAGPEPRISVLDARGHVLARIPSPVVPHGIAVDARGDILVAELGAVGLCRFERIEPRPSVDG
jgi:DNA-binding beta-propeller fold protein YncE